MSQPFVKSRADAPTGFFEAEAAGLRWLRASGGARVVDVLEVEPGRISLERVDESRPTEDTARRFGRGLAAMHTAGAVAFGARPDGYDGQLFIGARPMPSRPEESWGLFFARDRVLPFLELAIDAGTVSARAERDIRSACDLVASGAFDDDEPPARIHGDLWSGNVLWSADGVVLIDPAAHGGHRETDLAMLALFSCPMLETVLASYDQASPLRRGWRDRVPLHQLHPLAVHAAGHGPAYGQELHGAARATLELPR